MKVLCAFVVLVTNLVAQVLPLGSIPIGGAPLSVNSQMSGGVGRTNSSGASPDTWSFTNTSGNVLYVYVMYQTGSLPITTVTYNGVAMTQLSLTQVGSGESGFIGLFRLSNPATGANNVNITWTFGAGLVLSGAISFLGANATPDSGTATVNAWGGAGSATATVTVTGTTSGNFVIQGACYGNTGYSTQSGTRTFLIEVDSASFCRNLAAQYQSTPGGNITPTITTTNAGNSWVTSAIEVRH
jgi:hypothetical protein